MGRGISPRDKDRGDARGNTSTIFTGKGTTPRPLPSPPQAIRSNSGQMGAVGEGERQAGAHRGGRRGSGVRGPEVPPHPRPGQGGGGPGLQGGGGPPGRPLPPPPATRNIAITLPPSPSCSLLRGFPPSPGQRIGDPSYPAAAPTFPRVKLSAGPKEGCSGERGSAGVARGGGGAPSPGPGGERDPLGGCPEGRRPRARRSALPRPRGDRKALSPGPRPQVLARLRRPGAHGRSGARPLPKPEGAVGQGQGPPGSRGRPGGQRPGAARSPQPPRRPRTLPLATLGAGLRGGCGTKRWWSRETPNRYKGESASAILEGRKGKRGEKREKERRTGRARIGAGGVGRGREEQARLRVSPSHRGV